MSYISFYNIGTSGNLGSQMQQYASLYAVAKENNREIVFPRSYINLGYTIKIFDVLDIPVRYEDDAFFKHFVDIKIDNSNRVDQKIFNLDPNIDYNIDELFLLHDWWYPKYEKEVLGWKWNQHKFEIAKNKYDSIKIQGKETVSIHVRRGDYVWPSPHHNTFCELGSDYYENAILNNFTPSSKYQYVIFSNDINWCKENLIEGDSVTFIEPGDDLVDIILMSLCDHNIIANSTYSIWAAWRNYNENKIVVCPKNYLRPSVNLSSIVNGNYYPSNWIAIENS